MATRNVQLAELPELAQAWGNVAAIVVDEPRLSKKGVQLANLKNACSEMFEDFPVASRRTFSWKNQRAIHYNETKEFLAAAKVEVVPECGATPFGALAAEPATLMWEHDGKCLCGRRSYIFGQCSKCIKEESWGKATAEQ